MKKAILFLAVISLFFVAAGPASAVVQFFPATIDAAGLNTADDQATYFIAVSTTGAWVGQKWFAAVGPGAKAVLATALAAKTGGLPVWIAADSDNLSVFYVPTVGLFLSP